jgi:hypothetical protein
VSIILAIDPGPQQSAFIFLYEGGVVVDAKQTGNAGIINNEVLRDLVVEGFAYDDLVIESVESYGMPVGKTVFDTCYWIGRFDPRLKAILVPRRDVKLHLCDDSRAKDSNIRQALIDRFGPGKDKAIGLKASPGPLYGFKSHLWSALALAVTFHDLGKERWTHDEATAGLEDG